jgi:hypothetical protein
MENPTNDIKARLRSLFTFGWNPKPIKEPEVDPELLDLDPLTRSAESIRYSILSLEFWISPNGQVREWIRNNTRLAMILAIPALVILPIITFALWQLVSWLVALGVIAGQLIVIPVLVLLAVLSIWIAIQVLKSAFPKN